jgi:hypothetical protein
MSITRDEAARALGEVDGVHERLREVTAYTYAAPYLIIWGVAWLIADVGTQLGPPAARSWIWPVVACVFAAGSIAVSVFQFRAAKPPLRLRRPSVRVFGTMAAVVAFCVTLELVFWPYGPKQAHSMFGLVAGFAYVLEGLWLGWRLLLLGLALVGLTLFGFYALPLFGGYLLFMGVVGGGALILGGLWLRRL